MKKVNSLGDNDAYELLIKHGGCGYPYSHNEIKKVYKYLNESSWTIPFLGFRSCRFGCEDVVFESYYTDGVWLWQKGLLHYLTDHFIELPEEFLSHILGEEVRPDLPKSWMNLLESAMFKGGQKEMIDGTFWMEWSLRFLNKKPAKSIYFVKSPFRKEVEVRDPFAGFYL